MNLKHIIFITAFVCATLANAQEKIHLSNLDLKKVEQPFWTAEKDRALSKKTLNIRGKKFWKGIATTSKSSFFVEVQNPKKFTAKVGLQTLEKNIKNLKSNVLGDGLKLFYKEEYLGDKRFIGIANQVADLKKGSVRFIIKADGKTIWKSKMLRLKDKAVSVDLKLKKNVQVLEFSVEDGGDGIAGDNAVWANPVLYYNGKKTPRMVSKNFAQGSKENKYYKQFLPKIKKLPLYEANKIKTAQKDYLVSEVKIPAQIYRTPDNKSLILHNGLVRREFRVTPNCATIGYKNVITGETYLRAISPEATVTIDGKKYEVGGLSGQVERAYLKKEWIADMWAESNAFVLKDFEIGKIVSRINWKNKRWALVDKKDTQGISINFTYENAALKGVIVKVHYNLYQGNPLISKWITVENKGQDPLILNEYKTEILAMPEVESAVQDIGKKWSLPNIHLESDYGFDGMNFKATNQVFHWNTDSNYTSQVSWELKTPCFLECYLPMQGPNQVIAPQETYESFRVWELLFDSFDRQRKALATNKFYQTIAPWTSENPIFMHLTTTDPVKVKAAVDQCVETGYEMVILSFGSGLNMEDISDKNINKFKELAAYAHGRGIELGGYSLLSSRWISEEVDVINYKTGKRGGVQHGSSPCLNSAWGISYFKKIKTFLQKTGFDLLEHDGSYPGQFCASTKHVGHRGLHDSQWKAWKRITDFYKWCNQNGISLNIPDWYYLNGSTKNGIRYREVNWSLPRERQLVLGRQNIYDGTWVRTPSMSWTFVPLTQYHGGGKQATLEPLKDHLKDYKAHMIQNYGAGVQACYRGPRLYDSKATKQLVISVVDWYKKYRKILNSPIIHIKRADGHNIDGFLHVNAALKEKALGIFFNSTDATLTQKIKIPLYYSGLTDKVKITNSQGEAKVYTLSRDYSIEIPITIAKHSYEWFVFEKPVGN